MSSVSFSPFPWQAQWKGYEQLTSGLLKTPVCEDCVLLEVDRSLINSSESDADLMNLASIFGRLDMALLETKSGTMWYPTESVDRIPNTQWWMKNGKYVQYRDVYWFKFLVASEHEDDCGWVAKGHSKGDPYVKEATKRKLLEKGCMEISC